MTDSGDVPCLHYGDVHAAQSPRLNVQRAKLPRVEASNARAFSNLKLGDLVFVDASEDLAGVGKSVEIVGVPEAGVISGLHTIAARFDDAVLTNGFKGYLQHVPEFRLGLTRVAAGMKVLATSKNHLGSIELALPNVDEQRAIAAVLSDMDAEIEGLEARRAKTALIKQGMAQALLTGRIRLLVDDQPAGDDPETAAVEPTNVAA